jgi:16S rRNA (adenine1518-N6/adenine1519-N6)-dimethyltransferase
LGQNLLVDKSALRRIIDAAEIKPKDIVLEVGPGFGTLTQELAKNAEKVIAVEKDSRMCQILKETLKDYSNIDIVNADILKTNLRLPNNYKIVANIPYYITSPLIRKSLESDNQPELIVLMVQKEVAKRICSKPPEMNLLAVSVQFYAEPKIISYVSKNSFWPKPKVDSAIIKIIPVNNYKKQVSSDLFFKIVKAGFSQPRKQLINNFSKALKSDKIKMGEWLSKNNIKPSQRAENLNIIDWVQLAKTLPVDC